MTHALHVEPTQPWLNERGELGNPIGEEPFLVLDPERPLPLDRLSPSATYTSPGFEYLTDSDALPARVRGVLGIVPRSSRVRHPTAQRRVGHLAPESHGGHIVAVSLGGYASGPNLFPQAANFNTSAYARLERGWRAALRDGVVVSVDIALALDPLSADVPSFVIVTYWEDGDEFQLPLLNESAAQ